MPETIPPACAHINSEIEALEEERLGLSQELAAAPPVVQGVINREIRRINRELGLKQQQLNACVLQHRPRTHRPDLLAKTVILKVNHAARTLGVAAVVRNVGRGNAKGPFRIDMAVTLIRGGFTTSIVHVFEVPASVILFGEPVLSTGVAASLVGDTNGLAREYVTERMEVPLYYRDENPSCVYEFDFLADSEHVVAESNEGNNRFSTRWWTVSPAAVQRAAPFVAEAVEAAV